MKNVIYGLSMGLSILASLFIFPSQSRADNVCEEESVVQVIKACHVITTGGILQAQACPVNTLPIGLDKSNQAFVNLKVYAANLNSTSSPNVYVLPPGTDPIYLRLTYGVNGLPQIMGPFDTFEFDPNEQIANDPLYKCIMPFTLDFSLSLGGLGCSEEQEDHLLALHDFKMEMVTLKSSTNTYELYPILDYSDPGDIYSCESFQETCGVCKNSTCNPLPEPVYDIQMCLLCEETDGGGSQARLAGDKIEQVTDDWQSQINPNPFGQEVILEVRSNENIDLDIEIFNATGQLIKRNQEALGANTQDRVTIDTKALSPGVYYFRLSDGSKTVTHKLIKLAD